jgi:capsid portal protein
MGWFTRILGLEPIEDDVNVDEEVFKALPAPSNVAPVPQSRQLSPNDVANAYMLEGLEEGGEPTRGLDYDQLLAMSRVPLIATIVQTRVNQVAEFATPSRDGNKLGFTIRLKDRNDAPTDEEQQTIKELYDFMLSCGDNRINYETNFEAFLRMLVRDSLIFDQACFEIVRNRGGGVAGFINVDSRTIRRAKMTQAEKESGRRDPKKAQFVQVINNKPKAEFNGDDLCFGIRRPRSDLRFHGYGFPELEEAITVITHLLNADIYNAANFTNGISVAGIIAVKSKMQPQLFRQFRREFYQMLSGSANAKKTPLLQLDPDSNEDLKALNLSSSNKDMEFQEWQHYLIKTICALYQIDPMEIGFKFGDEGKRSTLNQASGEERVLMSKEKGLRPLLRAIQGWLNKYVVMQLDDRFEIVFTGLDTISTQEELKMNIDKVKSFMTINEVRALHDLEPIPNGDTILDGSYMQNFGAEGGQDNGEQG